MTNRNHGLRVAADVTPTRSASEGRSCALPLPRLRFGLVWGSVVLCLLLPGGGQAAEADDPAVYRVGLAQACITPEEPLWLAGYGGRKHPSEGVLDDLYVQALAVEDSGGRRRVACRGGRAGGDRRTGRDGGAAGRRRRGRAAGRRR